MKGNHPRTAPQQARAQRRLTGRVLAQRLPGQNAQVGFQAAKMKMHGLVQPLGVRGPAPVFVLALLGPQEQRQQHGGHRHQQQQAEQPEHGPAIQGCSLALHLVEKVKVECGRWRHDRTLKNVFTIYPDRS